VSSERVGSSENDRETTNRRLAHDVGGLLVSVTVALVVAGVAGLATANTIDGWYADAEKTIWNPPNELFGPVWAVLYTLMAISAWLVWRAPESKDRSVALGLYAGQLAMNAAWTPLFFVAYDVAGGIALWVALAWIVLLDFVVLATVIKFWTVHRMGAVLLVPYWTWLLFATALNASIAVMNS
jgi:benzodiazapine receptor